MTRLVSMGQGQKLHVWLCISIFVFVSPFGRWIIHLFDLKKSNVSTICTEKEVLSHTFSFTKHGSYLHFHVYLFAFIGRKKKPIHLTEIEWWQVGYQCQLE